MINDSTGIVENALLEASLRRIRLIENMDYPDIITEQEYDNKIFDLIYGRTKEKKRLPKRITLILVATLTICFLIMFTVSAQVRTAVVDFFVEVYETFTSFFIDENSVENPAIIETRYEPTHFYTSKYEKTDNYYDKLSVLLVLKFNETTVSFSQYVIENNDITLDTEDASYEIKHINNQKIYYKVKNNSYTIKWLAYGYSFNLRCNESLGWEEIEKIITSLEPVTE